MTESTEAKDKVPAIRPKEDAVSDEFIPVKRGKVGSVTIYEVKEDELKDLENGPPSTLYLNFMTVDMSDFDKAVAEYKGAMKKSEEIAKKILENGADVQFVVKTTGLPEAKIRELK